MKESRFIELLNLYVDRQLSPSEASELEAEILRNGDRRKTYQQYCRMQRACTLLFEKERAQAPASVKLAAAVRDADRKIVEFPKSSSNWTRAFYPIAVAAAAACVAIVFVKTDRSGNPTAAPAPLAVSAPAEAPAAQAVTIPASATKVNPDQAKPAYYSVFTTRRLSGDRQNQPLDTLAQVPRDNLGSYAWMRDVELAPVPTLVSERLTLKSGTSTPIEDRILRSSKPVNGTEEMSAFQFQK